MPGSERPQIIAVRAYSSLAVTATEMRRHADRLFDEDNFQVILDTFHASRNGYMFVTTPLGAKLKQQIFDQGEGVGRGGEDRQRRLDRQDRNSVQHASIRAGPIASVGRELPALYPQEE